MNLFDLLNTITLEAMYNRHCDNKPNSGFNRPHWFVMKYGVCLYYRFGGKLEWLNS